jgi:ABC-type uncharacterized transport system substrate-binding protein
MKRRTFLTLLAAAATPIGVRRSARAQSHSLPRIAVLSPISAATATPYIDALRGGLRALGYVEGTNIVLELRFADGTIEHLPDLAAELAALKPTVIIAGSPPAALAARKVTSTIPIVMNSVENPIALGLAESVPRPGGNVTGFWWGDEGLIGKRLEFLKQLVPTASRIGILVHPDDPTATEALRFLSAAARGLALETRIIEVRSATEFTDAFAVAFSERLHALHVPVAPLFIGRRPELVALSAQLRIPVVYGIREFVTAGGLMSYGTSLADIYRRKARMVHEILTGTSPAILPIERPTKFEFVINQKTASALGLSLSPALIALADEVIE